MEISGENFECADCSRVVTRFTNAKGDKIDVASKFNKDTQKVSC